MVLFTDKGSNKLPTNEIGLYESFESPGQSLGIHILLQIVLPPRPHNDFLLFFLSGGGVLFICF